MLLGAQTSRQQEIIEIPSAGLPDPERKKPQPKKPKKQQISLTPAKEVWQISWMEEYHSMRGEFNRSKQALINERDSKRKGYDLLKAKITRQRQIISRLRHKYKRMKAKHVKDFDSPIAQTEETLLPDQVTETHTSILHHDKFTQTDHIQINRSDMNTNRSDDYAIESDENITFTDNQSDHIQVISTEISTNANDNNAIKSDEIDTLTATTSTVGHAERSHPTLWFEHNYAIPQTSHYIKCRKSSANKIFL